MIDKQIFISHAFLLENLQAGARRLNDCELDTSTVLEFPWILFTVFAWTHLFSTVQGKELYIPRSLPD